MGSGILKYWGQGSWSTGVRDPEVLGGGGGGGQRS